MISNNFLSKLSNKEKEELLIELCKTKKHLDNIEKTLYSFIKKNYFINLQKTLDCIYKTKDSILNNIQSNNGSNIYIAKNNITGEIYDIRETPFSFKDIDNLKSIHINKEITVYSIKEYHEFYNKQDGVYYYNNEGVQKSLYTNYENLLNEIKC